MLSRTFEAPKVPHISDGEIVCPRCGSCYLHHGRVIVFDRDREDAETVNRVTIHNGLAATHVVPSSGRNPSSRRGGVVIEFDCEGCGPGIELTLAQHKGNTAIAWRLSPGQVGG